MEPSSLAKVWIMGGGGLFKDNKTLLLNHEAEVAQPHRLHPPRGVHVILKEFAYGGDEPIFSERLERDGWKLTQEWRAENIGVSYRFRTIQPEIREKKNGRQKIRMTRTKEVLDSSDSFAVVSSNGLVTPVERAGWVDWDKQGRLIIARDGRISVGRIDVTAGLIEKRLIDLGASKPAPLVAPQWAQTG